jgi:hypothetical protein
LRVREDDGVPKKPPQALPADPGRRRGVRYIGIYVVWWDDGTWEWSKCVNCGAQLTKRESRERGCGPSCAAVVTAAVKEAILREERINAEACLEAKRRPATRRRRASKRIPAAREFNTTRLPAAPRPGNERSTRKPRGITNEQAKELARLQRTAGESYTGNGMTEREARAEIQRLTR